MRVVIAGGFTGGHIFCALAIARALRAARPDVALLIVGARGGMEVPIAQAAGFAVETVWLDGLERRLTARAVARSLLLPVKLGVSLAQAGASLRRFRPDVVVGVGAYVSFPTVAMAALAGIPVLLHEANARPGIANQLLARRADVVCLGIAAAATRFRGAKVGRVVHTGNPIRDDLANATAPSRREARRRLGLAAERKTVLVMGGSLGASRLNDWVLGAERQLATFELQLLWQTGRAHLADCRARFGGAPNIRPVPFIDDMPAAYAAADLVVAGAGAMTLAELGCLAKPAIIVPDRNVSEDHQLQNADAVRAQGGVVRDELVLGPALTEQLRALTADDVRLRELGLRMAATAAPGAADRIAAEIVALARR
ncbi:MAG TPA: UDP-N-acetylglucosamine--N-acetylmuramyl-(pentapeptide) pyrophosphoryl-undecaprenol N-acetylglucosamine transferase [Polyangia bacterium]